MNKIKLFQINTVANSGSHGRIAEQIGLCVKKNGWESYIAYGRGKPQSDSILIKIGNAFDIYFHGFISRILDAHGLSSKRATKKLIKTIQKIQPDIIHLHNIHGYYLNYPLLFSFLRESSIPVVWTLHDCWSYTGHCAQYVFVNCDKWKTLCYSCPQKNIYPISRFKDNSKSNYVLKKNVFASLPNLSLITPSLWLKKQVEQSFFKNYSCTVINNGIDIKAFSPSQKKPSYECFNDKFFIILGVASPWNDRKGFFDFIELSKKLSVDEKIVLVGISKSQKKQLPKNVIGIERTESIEELAHLYTHSNVFLNLSTEETLGMTTIESMACGTPVITYESSAVSEPNDPSCGITVPLNDINAVYESICTIKKMGKDFYSSHCIKRARTVYNASVTYEEYFSLYKDILNV